MSQPAIGGGRVFVSVGYYYSSLSVRALDANTGNPLWSRSFSGFALNPPTYDSGDVYVQRTDSENSYTMSLNALSGATNWATRFTAQAGIYMAPVVTNAMVFGQTGYYSGLTGYDRITGAQRFFVRTLGNLSCDEWTPAYYNTNVYMWVNGLLTEHNPQTGATNWIMTNGTPSEFLYSMKRSLAIADGRAYFTSTTKLLCVDLSQRQNVWSVDGPFSGTPAVGNGAVYAISNGFVNAYTTNGSFLRSYRGTNGSGFSGQLIVTDDALIAAGTYGIYVFNLADALVQQYISSYRTSCHCYYNSSISLANNTLYVSSGDSTVSAYSAADLWRFAMRGSNGNIGSPTPYPYGTNYVFTNAAVTVSLPSPIPIGPGTRAIVTGWSGSGSVPAIGNTNSVAFVVTNDSELSWTSRQQFFLDTTVILNGTISVTDSWLDSDTVVTISAMPSNYYHFVGWSGDLSGSSNVVQFSMMGPRAIAATFVANVVANDVPEWWLAQHNLPITDAAAMADSDGDMMANWQEFRAGTNPTSSNSLVRLTGRISGPTNSLQFTLRWPSFSGRQYRLWRATNGIDFSVLASNVFATPPTNVFSRTMAPFDHSFYFVEVQ